jgi:alpha-1,2-mannosyltransferase
VLIRSPRNTFERVLDFCTALLTSTLASPVAYTHHYGLVLPVFWLTFLGIRFGREPRFLLIGLLCLSYALFSNSFAIFARLADTHWNFLQSMPMFGAFILLGLLYALRIRNAKSAGASIP